MSIEECKQLIRRFYIDPYRDARADERSAGSKW